MNYQTRPINTDEIPLLSDLLYEAIFQRDGYNPIPRNIIEQPETKVFIES